MIYEFKCRATGPLVMTQAVAERILEIIGKAPGPQGIITVAQMAPAIDALKAAIAREKDARVEPNSAEQTDDPAKAISLAQRAYPLIQMLEQARAAAKDITWGV